MDWTSIIIASLPPTIISFVSLIISWFGERNRRADAKKATAEAGKANADAVDAVSDASIKLVVPLSARIDELQTTVTALRAVMAQMAEKHADEIADLRKQINERDSVIFSLQSWRLRHEEGIKRLAAQVVSLGGQPVYTLPSEESA